MSGAQVSPDAPDLEPWARSGTVLGAFRDCLPVLAPLDDEALVDTLLRSAFFALCGVRPPPEIPLTTPEPQTVPAGPLH